MDKETQDAEGRDGRERTQDEAGAAGLQGEGEGAPDTGGASHPATPEPGTGQTSVPPTDPPGDTAHSADSGGAGGGWGPPPSSSSTPPRPGERPEELRRSSPDRLVAGVCGGLGAHFSVDPVIFRIAFAVLTLFGGFGILVYALLWLLIPADDAERPVGRSLLAGHVDARGVAAAVLSVLGVSVFFTYVSTGFGNTIPLLAVAVVILYLVWHDNRKHHVRVPLTSPAVATPAESPAAPGTAWAVTDTRVASAPTDTPPSWWRAPEEGAPQPPTPKPRRPRSYVTPVTLSLAMLAVGVMWFIDTVTDVSVSLEAGIAVVLLVLALGLVAGSVLGRARLLLVPLALTSVLLAGVASIDVPLTGPTGDRTFSPVTASDVTGAYRMRAGDLTVDLNQLAASLTPDSPPVHVTASVAFGQIDAYAPGDVRVEVDSHVQIGDVRYPDYQQSGTNSSGSTVLEPAAGQQSRGTIVLDLKVGIGQVEVHRGTP